jgi:hypothetical protein
MPDIIRPIAVGIDKLRIGTNALGTKTLKHALAACKDLGRASPKQARKLSDRGGVHRYRYSVNAGEYGTIYVAFRPHRADADHPKFVVELNPNKLGAAGLIEARAALKDLLGDRFEAAMGGAFVTLIDYFADYPVNIREVFIDMTRKEICGVWGFQFDGHFDLETLYLGAGGTDNQVRGYDKKREESDKAGVPSERSRMAAAFDKDGKELGCRMRIEGRRLPGRVPLSRVHLLDNPFRNVSIAMIPATAKEFQEPLGRMLLDAARFLGWRVAVNRMNDANAIRRYKRAFNKYMCDWWKPDEAAVDVGVALLRTGLFPESAFDPKVLRVDRSTPAGATPTFDAEGIASLKKIKAMIAKAKKLKNGSRFDGLDEDDEERETDE